nr:TnsA endonuclease N-terminal domain-containing protein [Candidatus Sigynarchaeota archaeon]
MNEINMAEQDNNLNQQVRTIDGDRYEYLRPVQVRTIPLTYGSNRGIMPSLKLGGMPMEYESQLERDFYRILDHDPNCIDFQPQPWKLVYTDKNGKKRNFYPDCWAIFKDGKQYLFDIKIEKRYKKLAIDENWKLHIKALQEFCKKMGWHYQVMTDRKINSVRLDNIKDLLNAAKHFSPAKVNKDIGKFDEHLNKLLSEVPMKFGEIVQYLSPLVPLEISEVISLLKYRIYYFHLFIDWNIPLVETDISLQKEYPVPTYALVETDLPDRSDRQVIEEPREKIPIYDQKAQDEFNARWELVSPVINRFGKTGKRSDVESLAGEINGQPAKTYRWYRKWVSGGKVVLYPMINR